MSVYVSYTDESASAERDGKFLIAGYVADHNDWPQFSRMWSKEILEPSPSITYLHMTDIRSENWRERHGISRQEAEDKVHKAVHVISETDDIAGFVAQISKECYARCQTRLMEARIKSPAHHNEIDYICFIAYSLGVTNIVYREMPDVRRVNFHISKKKHISHYLEHWVQPEILKGLTEDIPELATVFGDVIPLSMEDHMPLQAADVLCWHLQRTYANRTNEDVAVLEDMEVLKRRELVPIDVPDGAIETLTENLIRAVAESPHDDQ